MTSDPRRNIVICLDGTGNQIEENISNVLKLYRVVRKADSQIIYYDQGVGTLGQKKRWGRWKQKLIGLLGLATGLGLDDNVLRAYEFLVRHHQEHRVEIDGTRKTRGDHIYIFGFSRGAHTARVLAGLIYEVGILDPSQVHLAGAALTAYKETKLPLGSNSPTGFKSYEGAGSNFRRMTRPRVGRVKFLGLWDTVSSVLIPNPKGILPPLVRENLPHTSVNPAVETVRHAQSVDERRRMFRPDQWPKDREYKPDYHSVGDSVAQDVKSVWFPGVHSDVGGGYERRVSGLSQIPLIWMLEEAKENGLKVHTRMMNYVTGIKVWDSRNTRYYYATPDAAARIHGSLTWAWAPLEVIPKRAKKGEVPFNRSSLFRWYIPWAEPRRIPDEDDIHPSVYERIADRDDYSPVNVRPLS